MSSVDQAGLELLPCAHCGSPAWLWFAFPQSETPWFVSIEHENDCILRDAMGSIHCCTSSEDMAAAWNRRAAPSAPAATLCQFCHDAGASQCDCLNPSAPAEVEGLVICDGCGCTTTDAELAEMRGGRSSLISCCPERKMRRATREDWDKQRTALTAQQAEIERLREALSRIANYREEAHEHDDDMGHLRRCFDVEAVMLMESIARSSLSKDGGQP